MELRQIIENFEKAARADETKGGGHPEDVSQIEKDFHHAKWLLFDKLNIVDKDLDTLLDEFRTAVIKEDQARRFHRDARIKMQHKAVEICNFVAKK